MMAVVVIRRTVISGRGKREAAG